MTDSIEVSIVIPAYNEEGAIAEVVDNTFKAFSGQPGITFEILVVDDGSSDATAALVPGGKAKLIRHPKNYGYGRSILTGIAQARYPLIGIIDADNTYNPEDLVKMVPLTRIYDMVIGSRQLPQESLAVNFLRTFLKFLVLFFADHASLDPNSGLRIFRKDLVLRGKNLFSKKFSFSTSLTFFASLTQQFIEYIPIQYLDRRGFSKVRHIRDSFRTLILVLSMALVFQPVKCFLVHIFGCCLGFAALYAGKPLLPGDLWLSLNLTWASFELLLAMSFLAFILSKAHDQRHPFK